MSNSLDLFACCFLLYKKFLLFLLNAFCNPVSTVNALRGRATASGPLGAAPEALHLTRWAAIALLRSDDSATASATAETFLMRTLLDLLPLWLRPWDTTKVPGFHRHYWMLRTMQIDEGDVHLIGKGMEKVAAIVLIFTNAIVRIDQQVAIPLCVSKETRRISCSMSDDVVMIII